MMFCTKCKTEKEEVDFRKRKNVLQAYCIICQGAYNTNYYKTIKGKYSQYKYHSRRRNILFNLSFDEFRNFWNKPCYYCNGDISTVGLDRINSDIGYVIENCVSCCNICNYAKLKLTDKEYIEHCRKVAYNFSMKENKKR